jgi:hypothetical protein
MRRLISALCLSLVFVGLSALAVQSAWADGPPVICNPNVDPSCTIGVINPGKPGGPTPSPSLRNPGPVTPRCSWEGVSYPCSSMYGTFNNGDGCYYKEANPYPTTGPVAVEYQQNGGGIYWATCPSGGSGGYVWLGQPAPRMGPTAAQLAQQAFKTLTLPKPTTGMSPDGRLNDGRPYTVVKAFTWFWSDPSTYKRLTARVAAGAVWAQVTVTPTALTFRPGDGASTVSCAGPGRAWVAGHDSQWAPPPGGCDYAYPRSTYGHRNGELTATYGITWTVTWTGSGGASGTLPDITTTTNSTFAVAEAQAVIVR